MVAGYALERRLGSGSFATVYRGIKVLDSTGKTECAAIKAITRSSEKLTKKVMENLELEISILRTYRHPNIVCLHDVQKTERHFYLILEYCAGGDVQRLIRTRKAGRITERLTRRLMRDLTAGLKFLWGQELIHRDIKPQNLLLTGPLPLDELHDPAKTPAEEEERQKANFPSEQFALKLADFGFARHLQTTSLAETLCGSPLYMAPEILQHQRYDAKADLWSVGTVLFEMISGRPPFHGENHIDLLRNIQRKAVRLPADVRVSKECVNLLRLLLNRNPLSRAGFKEYFEASEAFVRLGCEGEALPCTDDAGSIRKPGGLFPLGPISEGDESQAYGTGSTSMTTVATTATAMNKYQQGRILPRQQSGRDSERNTPTSSPPSSQYLASEDTKLPAIKPGNNTPSNIVSPPLAPALAPSVPAQPAIMSNITFGHQQQQQLIQHGHPLANTPQHKRSSHFAPLQPSPPGPTSYYSPAVPPPLSLDGGMPRRISSAHGQNAMVPVNQEQQPSHRSGDSSQSSSDDSGFVMVPHGESLTSGSPNTSYKGPEQHRQQGSVARMWKQTSPGSRFVRKVHNSGSPPASPGRSSHYSNTVVPARRSSGYSTSHSPHSVKGILGTSPSTGGALVGMMGMAMGHAGSQGNTSSSSQFQTITKFETIGNQQQSPSGSNIKVAAKMLSAAEDVGRRAVTVAHLGDTRAYQAMRLLMSGSFQSSTPMEGVEEEKEDQSSDGANSTSSSTLLAAGRGRTVSTDRSITSSKQQRTAGLASMDEDEEEDDDEMPFAVSTESDTDPNSALAPMLAAQVSRGSSMINSKRVGASNNRATTPAMIQAHFREALSCYVKALSMIKGAVGAAQRVLAELGGDASAPAVAAGPPSKSSDEASHIELLKRRCEVSHGWLTGQFKGVLERADAANAKIAELQSTSAQNRSNDAAAPAAGAAAPSSAPGTPALVSISSDSTNINPTNTPKVEELIYNHSLACGRDGAVKQLLGQNEVARSCYRSAGLLAETLLMESKLGDDDKNILENLVQGFAQRITELDSITMQHSRGSATTSTSMASSHRRSAPPTVGLDSVAEQRPHQQGQQHQAVQHTDIHTE